jgi:PAS domain S-box-containing protein
VEIDGKIGYNPDGSFKQTHCVLRDITDRKQAEDALAESVARLHLATNATRIGHWDWDLRTSEVYFSPEWKRQIGYENHEIPNLFETWQSHLHPDDLQRTTKAVEDYIAGRREDYAVEFRFRHKDGSYRWIYTRAEKQFDDTGKPCHLFGCHVDITERKRMEEALRESEEKMRSILDASPDAILQVGMDLKVLWANKASLELNPDILGVSCCEAYQACMTVDEQCVCKKAIESGQIETNSLCFPAVEGSGGEVCWENIGVPLRDSHGRVHGAILIGRNITERKMAERVMLEYQQRLRTQASQLSLAEERERRRIATDLHDNVIQGLALSMIKLDLLRESSEGIDEGLFGEVSETLSQAIEDMRDMTFDISSPTLYKLG